MSFTNLPYYNPQTANYTLLYSDDVVQFNCSSGSLVATLPTAVGYGGKRFTIRRAADATPANTLTINTTSSQTIDTRASGSIKLSPSDYAVVISDGSNWQVVTLQETIAASYQNLNVVSNTAGNAYNYSTKIFDTHSAVTTGSGNTWRFTAPAPGKYRVSASAYNANTSQNSIQIVQNGTAVAQSFTPIAGSANMNATATMQLATGDTVYATPTTTHSVSDTICNVISIEKIGN